MTRLPRLPLILLTLAIASGPAVAESLPDGARARLGAPRFAHPGVVSWVVPLPDGKRLLTLASDHRLRVWGATDAKLEREFEVAPPYGQINVALAPDRKSVATASSADNTIRVWDIETGKELRQFAALPANQAVYQMAWSHDGKSLTTYHHDRVFRTWDAVTGKEERQLALAPSVATATAAAGLLARLLPDGKSLAVVEDWSVRLLDAESGKELRWFGGHTAPITTVAFSPDGKLIATVATDRHARLWDVATGKTVARLPLPVGGGRHLSFDGESKRLAVGAADRTVRVFEVPSGKEVARIDPGLTLLTNFSLSTDGKTLYLAGAAESVVRVYDVATGKEAAPPEAHSGAVSALAWSPDGKTLASAGNADRSIILWDAATGKLLRRLPELEAYPTLMMQFSPDGKSLISFGNDRVLRVWDVAEGKDLRSTVLSPLPFASCALSRDGKLAALAGYDRKLRVWDVDKGELLHALDLKLPQGQLNFNFLPLAFAGDGRTLLGFPTLDRGTVRRWDAPSGKELAEVKGLAVAAGLQPSLSADGRNLVAVSGNTTTVTEVASGKVRRAFAVATPPPAPGPRPVLATTGAALSPDSRVLVVAPGDGTLRFWDTGTAKELATRKGLSGSPRLLAFAPDGKTLATAGAEPAVTLWDVAAAEARPTDKDLTADKMDDLWKDLGGEDATRAWEAILALESAPKVAVPYVEKRLRPGAALDEKAITKLIGGLDAEAFQEREDATEALIRAGPAVEAAVKKALDAKPSAEAKQRLEFILSKLSGKLGPDLDEVRLVRGVEVLERAGTAEARKVLEEFAHVGEGRLSAEARAAADRLRTKSPR